MLAADAEGVLMHDLQGFPYAWLPRAAFVAAWGEPDRLQRGRFPLRTAIRPVAERETAAALAASLPLAAT